MSIIPSAYAATIPLGPIGGVGKFQIVSATPVTDFQLFASVIVGAITAAAGIAFLFYFLTGALTWITSGGEKGKVETAQKQMTNAAIGLIAVIVSYFIAGIVATILDVPLLSPADFL